MKHCCESFTYKYVFLDMKVYSLILDSCKLFVSLFEVYIEEEKDAVQSDMI